MRPEAQLFTSCNADVLGPKLIRISVCALHSPEQPLCVLFFPRQITVKQEEEIKIPDSFTRSHKRSSGVGCPFVVNHFSACAEAIANEERL